MRVCLLASGSRGNAVYIESGDSRLLIDAGLSCRELLRRLDSIGVDGESLDALLVTHEHHDHCLGLGPVARKLKLPVLAHHETLGALPRLGPVDDLREFEAGEEISLKGISIRAFPITHDAAAPVGFLIDTPEGRIGVATDRGVATRLVAERLKGCRALVLESNHDEGMLLEGPYPWHLKQRVRGTHGHLSNGDSARLLEGLLWDGLEAVFLAHLSEVNNTPGLAESTARAVLAGQNLCDPQLILGCQARPSACFTT